MAPSSDTIIQKIEDSYSKIIRLYRSVPVTALLEPFFSNGWSVKDILSHVAYWEWRCVDLLQHSHERNALLQAQPDVDALNEESYQERKELDWGEVDEDLREAHSALIEAIRDFPEERLSDPVLSETIAEETWQHYEEHLEQLGWWHQEVTKKRRR